VEQTIFALEIKFVSSFLELKAILQQITAHSSTDTLQKQQSLRKKL
jgi:hypothetical protein